MRAHPQQLILDYLKKNASSKIDDFEDIGDLISTFVKNGQWSPNYFRRLLYDMQNEGLIILKNYMDFLLPDGGCYYLRAKLGPNANMHLSIESGEARDERKLRLWMKNGFLIWKLGEWALDGWRWFKRHH